jgi:hypothetical protein
MSTATTTLGQIRIVEAPEQPIFNSALFVLYGFLAMVVVAITIVLVKAWTVRNDPTWKQARRESRGR